MNSEISTNNDDIDPLLSLDQQQQQIRNQIPRDANITEFVQGVSPVVNGKEM